MTSQVIPQGKKTICQEDVCEDVVDTGFFKRKAKNQQLLHTSQDTLGRVTPILYPRQISSLQ